MFNEKGKADSKLAHILMWGAVLLAIGYALYWLMGQDIEDEYEARAILSEACQCLVGERLGKDEPITERLPLARAKAKACLPLIGSLHMPLWSTHVPQASQVLYDIDNVITEERWDEFPARLNRLVERGHYRESE